MIYRSPPSRIKPNTICYNAAITSSPLTLRRWGRRSLGTHQTAVFVGGKQGGPFLLVVTWYNSLLWKMA